MCGTINYRKLRRGDYRKLRSLLDDSFGLYHYTGSAMVHRSLLKLYLSASLAESTYGYVAEDRGKIVGVVMGRADNDCLRLFRRRHLISKAWNYRSASLFASLKKEDLKEYGKLMAVYGQMLYGSRREYDGECTLLAVDQAYQGMGIGKALLAGLQDYWERRRVKHIYLYSDSTCKFGLYEAKGFKKKKERLIWMSRRDQIVPIRIFLYEKTLR